MMKLRLRMVRVTLVYHARESSPRTTKLILYHSSCARNVTQLKNVSRTTQLKRERKRSGPVGADSDESEYETRYDKNTVNLKATPEEEKSELTLNGFSLS